MLRTLGQVVTVSTGLGCLIGQATPLPGNGTESGWLQVVHTLGVPLSLSVVLIVAIRQLAGWMREDMKTRIAEMSKDKETMASRLTAVEDKFHEAAIRATCATAEMLEVLKGVREVLQNCPANKTNGT
jgi:hypothetical protein